MHALREFRQRIKTHQSRLAWIALGVSQTSQAGLRMMPWLTGAFPPVSAGAIAQIQVDHKIC